MSKNRFFVAIDPNQNDYGISSCVDDGDVKLVREFYRENVGREIRNVDGDEMVRLMTRERSTRSVGAS